MHKYRVNEKELREKLSELQYRVTQEGGTEAPFSNDNFPKDLGSFHCVCCGSELFLSEKKYDSGTGWPSFYEAVEQSKIELSTDYSNMMVRTEARCSNCSAHLGHVFDDGPQPTGTRYCMNGSALKFNKRDVKA